MDVNPPFVAVCLSCRQLYPEGARCACIVARAQAVAELGYELHRASVAKWRRPRPWAALTDMARQSLTGAGLDLVEAVEGRGWRLVDVRTYSAHVLPEGYRSATWDGAGALVALEPEDQADPPAPATAPTPLGRELERATESASYRPTFVQWPLGPDWPVGEIPEEDYVESDLPGEVYFAHTPVVPRYIASRDPDGEFDPRRQITDPPMLDGVTLREWLIHHTARDNVWSDVVREFYMRAAESEEIASYFHEVLARPDGWERLQRHFTAALVMVTGQGVTAGTLRSMRERHAGVLDRDGNRIDGVVYGAVIDVLVSVLRRFGVPAAGIAALAATIRPLRDVIVADPDTAPGGYPAPGAPGGVQ